MACSTSGGFLCYIEFFLAVVLFALVFILVYPNIAEIVCEPSHLANLSIVLYNCRCARSGK